MTRVALALVLLAGCVPAAPLPVDDDTVVAEEIHAEQATMTLSVRRVSQPGWSGRIVVASFSPGRDRHVRVVPNDRPAPLSEIAAGISPPEPFAVIDGGFYETTGEPMGLVRAAGLDHHPLGERGGSGVLVVDGGRLRIVHRDAYEPSPSITDALQSIDRLVNGGSSVVGSAASHRRAARSAVALDREGTLHLVVAFDDRAVASETEARIELGAEATRSGPTISQMAELLMRAPQDGGVGAEEALGLDGGFSTSMMVKSAARSLSVVAYHATINGVLATVNEL